MRPTSTLFRPIVERLSRDGHGVVITASDHGQAKQLSLTTWPDTILVGSQGFHVPALAKGTAILGRAAPWLTQFGTGHPTSRSVMRLMHRSLHPSSGYSLDQHDGL